MVTSYHSHVCAGTNKLTHAHVFKKLPTLEIIKKVAKVLYIVLAMYSVPHVQWVRRGTRTNMKNQIPRLCRCGPDIFSHASWSLQGPFILHLALVSCKEKKHGHCCPWEPCLFSRHSHCGPPKWLASPFTLFFFHPPGVSSIVKSDGCFTS